MSILERAEAVIACETNLTNAAKLRSSQRREAAAAEIAMMSSAREAATADAQRAVDAAERARAASARAAERNRAAQEALKAEIERRSAAEAAAAARRSGESSKKVTVVGASAENVLAQAQGLAAEEREVVNETVRMKRG